MNIRGERILILGDSLSAFAPFTTLKPTIVDLLPGTTATTPGGVLGKRLLASGAEAVRVNARVGRSAISFLNGESGLNQIAGDVAEFRPTKVIVFLGTNDIDRGTTKDALARTQNAMVQIRDAYRHAGADVFAFGPPMYGNYNYAFAAPTMFETIQKAFGAARTLDLRPLTSGLARSRDGVHFPAASAEQAADRIVAQLPALGAIAPTTGLSTGAKIALGVAGFSGLVGLTWLTAHVIRRADHRKALALAFRAGSAAGRWFARRR